jgi:hypothetical protein
VKLLNKLDSVRMGGALHQLSFLSNFMACSLDPPPTFPIFSSSTLPLTTHASSKHSTLRLSWQRQRRKTGCKMYTINLPCTWRTKVRVFRQS